MYILPRKELGREDYNANWPALRRHLRSVLFIKTAKASQQRNRQFSSKYTFMLLISCVCPLYHFCGSFHMSSIKYMLLTFQIDFPSCHLSLFVLGACFSSYLGLVVINTMLLMFFYANSVWALSAGKLSPFARTRVIVRLKAFALYNIYYLRFRCILKLCVCWSLIGGFVHITAILE